MIIPVLGGGIGLKELILLLDGAIIFIMVVAIATNNSGLVIEPAYNIYNTVFFDGVDITNKESCGAITSFFESDKQIEKNTTSSDGFFDFLDDAINAIGAVGSFFINFFGFLARLLTVCGLDMIRLMFGWSIILMNLFYLFSFVNAGREALNP